MIDLLVDILHSLDIEVLVSPYEADAQISYLVMNGRADFGVSEDSDLFVFGCPRLMVKLKPTGDC
jgi:exonuclease-1